MHKIINCPSKHATVHFEFQATKKCACQIFSYGENLSINHVARQNQSTIQSNMITRDIVLTQLNDYSLLFQKNIKKTVI